jgi:hypothetical protein
MFRLEDTPHPPGTAIVGSAQLPEWSGAVSISVALTIIASLAVIAGAALKDRAPGEVARAIAKVHIWRYRYKIIHYAPWAWKSVNLLITAITTCDMLEDDDHKRTL